jgi:superfamily II DNA or RNA helicase
MLLKLKHASFLVPEVSEDFIYLAQLKKKLTLANPDFIKRQAMKLSLFGISPTLTFYKVNTTNQAMMTPVGATHSLLSSTPALISGPVEITNSLGKITLSQVFDERTDIALENKIVFRGELRDYQHSMLEPTKHTTLGIIQAETGSGKTVCFIKLICDLSKTTLILVNRKELANQTIEKLVQFTNLTVDDIGIIGDTRKVIKPVTVALHQSLSGMSPDELFDLSSKFSVVISDEVHTVAAKTYFANLNALAAKYKYGFSATPIREDGLTPLIHWASGNTIYVSSPEITRQFVIKPTYTQIQTGISFPLVSTDEYTQMINWLCANNERQEFLLQEIIKEIDQSAAANEPAYMCVLGGRVDQIVDLANKLNEAGKPAIALHSKLKKKDRDLIMGKLLSREIHHVVSSWELFSTGIDIPHLNRLAICAPVKSEIKVKQGAGRIRRPSPSTGKVSAKIIDFVDDVWLLKNSAKTRKKHIESL